MKTKSISKCRAAAGTAVALLLVSSALNDQAWAITGGEPDNNRHPNVGVIIAQHPDYGTFTFCSGTLIHEQVFLTAGHALAIAEAEGFTLLGVSFAEKPFEDSSSWMPIAETFSILKGTGANQTGGGVGIESVDIAAFVLAKPVKRIVPEPLPPVGFLDALKNQGQLDAGPEGTRFTVVGYGMLLDSPPPRAYWEDPVRRNLAQSGYAGLNAGWLALNQNLAAGYGGTARGDSGGPTFWTDPETGEEVLVSITIWGDPNFMAIGMTYRLDTVGAQMFLQGVLKTVE